jgi:hypothetical protein
MRLIAPLMQAEERWTMKEYPSEEMRVTYSLSPDMFVVWLRFSLGLIGLYR